MKGKNETALREREKLKKEEESRNLGYGCLFITLAVTAVWIFSTMIERCSWGKAVRDINKYSEVDIDFLNPIFRNYSAVLKHWDGVIEETIPPSFDNLLADIPNKKIALSGSIHEVHTHPNDNEIIFRYDYFNLPVYYEFKLEDPVVQSKGDFVKIYGTIDHLEYRRYTWPYKAAAGSMSAHLNGTGSWHLYVCVRNAFTDPDK